MALFKVVKEALSTLCRSESGADACEPYEWRYNVEYNDHGHIANNAHFSISVKNSNFPWNLREALINTVAEAYAAQTTGDKNCYQNTLGGKVVHWCNVGSVAEVSTVMGYGAWLNVKLEFNGDTTDTHYDCSSTQEGVRRGIANLDTFKVFEQDFRATPAVIAHCDN